MISRLNEKYGLMANTNRKLAKSTQHKAVTAGIAGQSPKKKGPPPRIPPELVEVVAAHAEVSQVAKWK